MPVIAEDTRKIASLVAASRSVHPAASSSRVAARARSAPNRTPSFWPNGADRPMKAMTTDVRRP
jgi:hypothetical protein